MGDRIPARKFQDLIAWQRARTLTRDVYEATTEGSLGHAFSSSNRALGPWDTALITE